MGGGEIIATYLAVAFGLFCILTFFAGYWGDKGMGGPIFLIAMAWPVVAPLGGLWLFSAGLWRLGAYVRRRRHEQS